MPNFLKKLLKRGKKNNNIINQSLINNEETKSEIIEEILNLDDMILPLGYKDTTWGEFKEKILSKQVRGWGVLTGFIRCLDDELKPFLNDLFNGNNEELLEIIKEDHKSKDNFDLNKKILENFVNNTNQNHR